MKLIIGTGKVRGMLMALCLGCAANGYAAGKTDVLPGREGWFLGAGVGVQTYIGEGGGSFGDRISPIGELAVGKWITPVIGMNLNMGAAHVGNTREDGTGSGWNYIHVHLDGMVDLTAIIKGVDEERKHSLLGSMGVGVATPASRTPNRTTPTFVLGMIYKYKASRHIDWFVEGKGYIVGDKLNGIDGGRKGEGALALTTGFVYKF